MTEIRFALPYVPPTTNDLVNALVIKGQARLVRSREDRIFRVQLVADLKRAGVLPPHPLEGPLELHCAFWFASIASDVSNRVKALEDGLTEAGVWHDDKQVASVHLVKHVAKGQRMHVIVRPAANAQPELVERLEESRRNRQRRETRDLQTGLNLAVANVRSFR